jgi:hypothetical protein
MLENVLQAIPRSELLWMCAAECESEVGYIETLKK